MTVTQRCGHGAKPGLGWRSVAHGMRQAFVVGWRQPAGHASHFHNRTGLPPQVSLVLTENDYTKSMWPHSFRVVYSVSLHGAPGSASCGLWCVGTGTLHDQPGVASS